MVYKNFSRVISRIILIGVLVFSMLPFEVAYGCAPPEDWEIFLSGDHFVIGEVVEIVDSEILIDTVDYFISEVANDAELVSEIVSFPGYSWQIERFEQGDYVIASFDGENFCEATTGAIFHVTSLDYATLQVEDTLGRVFRMLTDFVNHRGAYAYYEGRNSSVYRQHRQNPMGWMIAYDPTSLVLGEIIAFERDEVTIEIWDYVTPNGEELAFDRLTLYQDRHHLFNNFNVGDDVAVKIRIPIGDGDARTLMSSSHSSMDIFSVNVLEDGSVQLENVRMETVREDSSLSALYTDLLQHRRNYPYVVTFGSSRYQRYQTVARLVDGELIMIYEQEEPEEADEVVVLTAEPEPLTLSATGDSEWPTLAMMSIGISGALGVIVVFLVVKKRKRVLKDEKYR